MARVCDICGKGPSVGRRLQYRGLPKYKGGIGLKITANEKRRFLPNLQKVKVLLNGAVCRKRVCTACIRSGRITKAPVRPSADEIKALRTGKPIAAAVETPVEPQVEPTDE